MDNEKLYHALLNDETIKDIPIIFIIRVTCSVLRIINEGECFKNKEIYYE